MRENILSVKDLSVVFQGSEFQALNSISFDLKEGSCTALVGESGSGKSLSSLAIMGLLPKNARVTSGQILLKEADRTRNLLTIDASEHRQLRGTTMSMIFQEPMTSLNPTLTCGYQVAEMLREHTHLKTSQIKNKVIELFKEVRLPRPNHIYTSYPHQISGGQKQRVMIAMAIACQPRLLIADEPTTALDVTVQKDILMLLKELQVQRKMTVLFITHDLEVVKDFAQHIVVMQQGRGVERGLTEHIFAEAQHPYTQGLLACRPPIDKRPRTLQTVSSFLNKDSLESIDLISEQERKQAHEKIYKQTPILKVENLKTRFVLRRNWLGKPEEYLNAVNQVSFDLYQGETLGLVGESGCGKTTLGRSLLKLETPQTGCVWFDGKNVLDFSKAEMLDFRKQVQIVFQDPYSSLNPKLTIGAILNEVLWVHKMVKSKQEASDKVHLLLQQVGLDAQCYSRYPHELSGGQRQRVGIARALALEPQIIICDESVSALDVSVQAQVLNLLNQLKKDFDLTYIFISHDLSVVRYMSDRLIVMNGGVVEEMGESDHLFANPQKRYTQKLIQSTTRYNIIK